MPRHVDKTEAYRIIANSMEHTVPELAEIHKRTVGTIQRVLDNPDYAEFKKECEEALKTITLADATEKWRDNYGDGKDNEGCR